MTTEQPSPAPKKRSRRWLIWIGSLVLLFGAVGAGVWGWFRYRVWPEETRALLERKNLAVAYLENEEFTKADPLFEELADEVPDEPLAARNLLISRLLTFKESDERKDREAYAKAKAQVEEALARLQRIEGDTAIVHLLAGRLAELNQDEKSQLDHYAKAAQLDPSNPVAWAAVYMNARFSQDPIRKLQAREALKRAYALRPNNLVLLLDLMQQQTELQDIELLDTLVHAREVTAPFAEGIRRLTNFELLPTLDAIIAELQRADGQDPDWGIVRRQVLMVNNVVRRETATQRDRNRIVPHELEFVLQEFSPEFYASAYLPQASKASSIPVTFRPTELSSVLSNLSDIRYAALVDFDLDGSLDVLIVRDAAVEVYARDANGEWQQIASATVPAGMRGAIAADLDRDQKEAPAKVLQPPDPNDQEQIWLDTDPDLCVYGDAGMVILKNQFDAEARRRTLELVSQSEGFQKQTGIRAAAFADLDQDGDLDLAASGEMGFSLWLNLDNNLGANGFDDITNRSALPPGDVKPTGVIPVDWDRNVAMDLVLVGQSGPVGWLENIQHGRFRWQPFEREFQVSAAALVDADANASWDLLCANDSGLSVELTNTPNSRVVQFQGPKSIGAFDADGITPFDYDNDGYMDFVAWNAEEVRFFQGQGSGAFEAKELLQLKPEIPLGCNAGDVDSDGDLDLLFHSESGVTLYENQGGNANSWIDIFLRADHAQYPEQRCPMQGLGSLLELRAGERYQPMIVTGAVTHFGLGSREQADMVRVLWTNGIPANIVQPPKNTLVREQQVLKGSCPYLYTWNGERFVFVTDLLWAAPIGLQFAEYVLAPSREWEYLRITDDRLQPKDGEYHLQITEELWEAGYFDLVELLAIDHPADVEIHTNEKVGPAELAKHRLYGVKHPRVPEAATDQNGRDVLEKISKRDEDYVKAYDSRIKQGLTKEHFLELDLGELESPKTITLFLTGWMYPTDTSLNVGLGHNPTLPAPRPPYVLIPDALGQWKEAISYMGFPGGKTKTIAVEIPASLFHGNDYRLRIATSMEIAWDEAIFTVDEPTPNFTEQPLKLLGADLHYRGFSERIRHPRNGPDRYDYDKVSTEPKWPPMMGHFTRYGDVSELVQTADDRLAVLGAGDEMTLRFQAPPPPPEGFQRTFVLHNVGWDKDADLNTVLGETVEPLPFRAMKQYPYEPHQSAPDTPEYRDYMQRYQTRTQSDARFWKRLTSPDLFTD